MVELLLSRPGQRRRTEPWTTMRVTGSASGSGGSTSVKSLGTSRFPDQYLHDVLGLVRLSDRPESFPWAKA